MPFALLHCTSMYPTPYEKVGWARYRLFASVFPMRVIGLCDHSIGNYTCFGAVALGASILEKHFTSDMTWPGRTSRSRSIPRGWRVDRRLARDPCRLGGTKESSRREPTIDFAYACVVSIRDISEGEVLDRRQHLGQATRHRRDPRRGLRGDPRKGRPSRHRTRYPDPSGGHWLNSRKAVEELTIATAVVTGAAGFLGARLTGRLAGLGARVIGIDRAEGASSAAAESVGLDLLDADAVRVAFMTLLSDDAASAVVIHLAGRGHVGANRDDPHGAVAANVVGITNVLEVCRAAGVRRVVFPSSALVYKRPALLQLGEDAPVASTSIYAATKLHRRGFSRRMRSSTGFHAQWRDWGTCTVAGAADSVASIVIR